MKAFISMWRMDPRIRPYVIRKGFYGIYRLGSIMIDWPLITCLIERWRPETYMFHVPVGEMMFMLQDVAIILVLYIQGLAVTGHVFSMWWSYVGSCSMSPYPRMLSEDSLSPYDVYVTSYPPQHLMQMRSL